MTKQAQLAALTSEIITQGVCLELSKTAHQLVMGSGSLDADIVLIGEAPGKSEDLSGMPFVGASGKFLDRMLEEVGMLREDVYITNIVKYRPPNNRDPSKKEIAEFWPYLLRQLEVIRPKVCITLGRFSMNCFLPDAQIGHQHGKPVTYSDNGVEFLLIPLYHPAAALYNGSMRQVLIDDFVAASKLAHTV